MKKIILTVGCPGSGKSTWANEYVKNNPGFYILSLDDFREKLFGLEYRNQYKYTKQREKAVSEAQFSAARGLLALEETKGIIIADTNLKQSTKDAWYKFCYTEHQDCMYETKFFGVSWTELVSRNTVRGTNAVPITVLRDMYAINSDKYNASEYPERPKAVIFDLDGTLADNNHRSPYDLKLCGEDKPKEMVILFLKMLRDKGYKILTVSGRESGTKEEPEVYKDITKDWLSKYVGETEKHFQRKQGDSRKDDIVKEEIFWNEIVNDYDVVLAIDDRDSIVEMWRRIGIECWQVNHGNF